jgi:hypothetical protein
MVIKIAKKKNISLNFFHPNNLQFFPISFEYHAISGHLKILSFEKQFRIFFFRIT